MPSGLSIADSIRQLIGDQLILRIDPRHRRGCSSRGENYVNAPSASTIMILSYGLNKGVLSTRSIPL